MSIPVAWVLLAIRTSGAVLILALCGLPQLLAWLRLIRAERPPLELSAALALGVGIFAYVLCPLLIGLGVYSRLACITAALALCVASATGETSAAPWLLALMLTAMALLGPGALTLNRAQGHASPGRKAYAAANARHGGMPGRIGRPT